jgi:hypothetical protein
LIVSPYASSLKQTPIKDSPEGKILPYLQRKLALFWDKSAEKMATLRRRYFFPHDPAPISRKL